MKRRNRRSWGFLIFSQHPQLWVTSSVPASETIWIDNFLCSVLCCTWTHSLCIWWYCLCTWWRRLCTSCCSRTFGANIWFWHILLRPLVGFWEFFFLLGYTAPLLCFRGLLSISAAVTSVSAQTPIAKFGQRLVKGRGEGGTEEGGEGLRDFIGQTQCPSRKSTNGSGFVSQIPCLPIKIFIILFWLH